MIVLGIHGGVTLGQHDPGAAIVRDGRIVAACEEERLIRVKSPRGFLPIRSIAACLAQAGMPLEAVDVVAHAGETYEDMPERIRQYLLHYFGAAPRIEMVNHQLAHLASAFHASGFERAMCLACDAYGDRESAALAVASRSGGIRVLETRSADDSLGMFYATMTSYLGFEASEDEYKIMGLAAHGAAGVDLSAFARPVPSGYEVTSRFIRRDPPLRSKFEPFYSRDLVELLGPPRRMHEPLERRHRDVAWATQDVLERCMLSLVRRLHERTGERALCLAGGVALNCAANGKLSRLPFVESLFVQPAASDRGLALGCALHVAFESGEKLEPLRDVFLGPCYEDSDLRAALEVTGARWERCDDLAADAAERLANGQIVGWFQGRAELGPRALGHRSILADPRQAKTRDVVNARVKFREEFRPFAPAVLDERASELFDVSASSPFMTVACRTRPEQVDRLGAVTHVDGTARVQTVARETDPLFHALISEFDARTGVPALLNTSFNVRGQPIVESPLDALATFGGSGLDVLYLGPYCVSR